MVAIWKGEEKKKNKKKNYNQERLRVRRELATPGNPCYPPPNPRMPFAWSQKTGSTAPS